MMHARWMLRCPLSVVTALLLSTLTLVVPVLAAPPPAIEFSSLLESSRVRYKTGNLQFGFNHNASGVFLPPPQGHQLEVAVARKGSTDYLVKHPCVYEQRSQVWSTIHVRDSGQGYTFREPGEYTLTYLLDGKPITAYDFVVRMDRGDDPFEPETYTYTDGPWNDLAFFYFWENEHDRPLEFHFWTRKITTSDTPPPDKYTIQLLRGDELVAVTTDGIGAWAEWQKIEHQFTFPQAQGGRKFAINDLLAVDGKYTVTVQRGGDLYGHYNFAVVGGKIEQHPRQVVGYEPSTQWLVPRRPGLGYASSGNVYWLSRSKVANADPAETPVEVRDADRDRWQVVPDADPRRPVRIVHTRTETRHDTPLSAGNGVVAFATGSTQGVGYLVVGDERARSIPNGQQYRADLFHVVGKKIVLANQYHLFVYDTVSGQTHAIGQEEIHLRYQKGALYGPRLVDTDGYLVVTVNEPTRVRDRVVIKVLDLSAPSPTVIALSNVGFTVDDVSSVKVSARYGYVAVASKRKQAVFVAQVAPGARFRKYDISGFDSFGEMDMALTDRHVAYLDAAGFANLRLLDLESEEVAGLPMSQHGGSWGTTVASNGTLITWPTKDPLGTFVVSEYGADPVLLEKSGERVSRESNYGRFGRGNSAVVTRDGAIFLAGSGNISGSRCLQMAVDGTWHALLGDDGQPIPAIDVVLGDAMIAFKTGDSRRTTVSYATFGERIAVPTAANVAAQTRAPLVEQPERSRPAAVATTGDDNPHFTLDEQAESYLEAILESDAEVVQALSQAFGAEAAKKKVVEMTVKVIKEGDHPNLVDEYLRRSPLVPEGQKPPVPASKREPSAAASPKIEGKWRAARFVVNGQEPVPDSMLEQIFFSMQGGRFETKMGANVEKGSYTVDTSTTPYQITMTIEDGALAGVMRAGIFKVIGDGKQLITVFATTGPRPSKFVSTAESGTIMSVYQRVE